MIVTHKPQIETAISGESNELTLELLLGSLASHKERPLIFTYDGQRVKPGYHVTEVKAGHFDALDCGANPESWTEVFVQLWDVDGDGPHMNAGKFSGIISKVSERVDLDQAAKLSFEVSDGIRPMQIHHAGKVEIVGQEIHVALKARPASCKPLDRALETERKAQTCCAPSASGVKCCG
jgi:hypothetical protein